jgi:dipeptidyl aminopeptidase/acylaminoacyl peptidase
LVVSVAYSGPIVIINLDGQITSVIFSGSLDLPTGELSSDNKIFAYIVGSGYRDRSRYEVQNLLVRNLEDDNNSLNQISSNGGVWDIAWSPDGSMIAYTDYDAFGIMQLYVANPNGTEIHQISNNQRLGVDILEIRWSNEGEAIAYLLDDGENGYYVRVNKITHLDNQFIEYGPFKSISDFWWHSGNKLGIFYNDNLSENTWKITWYQAFSKTLIRSLDEVDTPSQNIFIPKPVKGTDSIGYFDHLAWYPNEESWFYIYDYNLGSYTSYKNFESFNEFEELRNWFPIIITIEENSCFPLKNE